MLDVGGTLGRTPGRPFCVNNRYDNPRARLPQSPGKSAGKGLLRLDRLDLRKTRTLRQLCQISAKGSMRRLPASEFELAIIPDDVNEIAWRPRRRRRERIQVHQYGAIAIENDYLLVRPGHG